MLCCVLGDLTSLSQFVVVETNDLNSGKYPILGHFCLDFPFFSELCFLPPLFFLSWSHVMLCIFFLLQIIVKQFSLRVWLFRMAVAEQLGDDSWWVVGAACCHMALLFEFIAFVYLLVAVCLFFSFYCFCLFLFFFFNPYMPIFFFQVKVPCLPKYWSIMNMFYQT